MKKKLPFRSGRTLLNQPISKLPSSLRTLYKNSSVNLQNGGGPRTLDSVISYFLNNNNNTNFNFNFNSENDKIYYCMSQKDFPINLHQRFLLLLTLKKFNLQNIHWIITFGDHINEIYPRNSNLEILDHYNIPLVSNLSTTEKLSKYNDLKQNYFNQLDSYIKGFQKITVSKQNNSSRIQDSQINANTVNNKENIQLNDSNKEIKENNNVVNLENELFKIDSNLNTTNITDLYSNFKLNPNNLHICSLTDNNDIGLKNLLNETTLNDSIYVVGQANSGKSKLINMINNFLENANNTDFPKIDSKFPFYSGFKTYDFNYLKLIDSPGIVRTNGGIWSHLNKFGSTLNELPCQMNSEDWQKLNVPKIMFLETDKLKLDWLSLFNGMIFVKPIIKNLRIKKYIKVAVFRNLPGKVKTVSKKQKHSLMYVSEDNKLMSEMQWSKYQILNNDGKIEIILDNIGSFTLFIENEIKDEQGITVNSDFIVDWVLWVPERVRILSRKWDDKGSVFFESVQRIK